MKGRILIAALGACMAAATPVSAITSNDADHVTGGGGVDLPPYLQCVPYARQVSGIRIFGDAHTWWQQAEGRYARGFAPRVGAVMNFRPHGNSRLGHVAAVSRIVDSRTVLIRHANWSPINGRRGQIEDNVRAVDVSPNNDWSAVRVWYGPTQALGGTAWPLYGFIYKEKPGKVELAPTSAPSAEAPPRQAAAGVAPRIPPRIAPLIPATTRYADDPIGEIIARNGTRRH